MDKKTYNKFKRLEREVMNCSNKLQASIEELSKYATEYCGTPIRADLSSDGEIEYRLFGQDLEIYDDLSEELKQMEDKASI